MYSPLFLFALLLLIPLSVLACEGECIVGITKAFLSSYNKPVYQMFASLATEIEQKIIPPQSHAESPFDYISALLSHYEQQSYTQMETAIFPSYFHGKCQLPNGPQNPPGCPNPDCPIICGTPGSLVHFYSHLRRIAYATTKQLLSDLSHPDSPTYKSVEKSVLKYANRPVSRAFRGRTDLAPSYEYNPWWAQKYNDKRDEKVDAVAQLKPIMERFPLMLADICGGVKGQSVEIQDAVEDELQECSWSEDMKKFILSFP